jgi:hypothetical protein
MLKGLRFFKAIKLMPGLRLGIGKSGIGLGPRGLHIGINSRGKPYISLGLPGTGVGYRKQL